MANDKKVTASDPPTFSFKTAPGNDDLDDELTPQAVSEKGFQLTKKIGGGGFSLVYIAQQTVNGKTTDYAAKVIRFDQVPEEWKAKRLKEELKITRKLDYKHIVKVVDVVKTKRLAFIFMELASGSLEDELKAHKNGIPEANAKVWFTQLANAVKFIHDKGVAHRDLKLENVLLDSKKMVKLSDFGFACFTFDKNTREDLLAHTACGTRPYQAPESFSPPYDARISDIWSLGVVLFEMLTARLPFPDGDKIPLKTFFKFQQQRAYKWPPNIGSAPARDLVAKMLDPNPRERITDADIIKHNWITH